MHAHPVKGRTHAFYWVQLLTLSLAILPTSASAQGRVHTIAYDRYGTEDKSYSQAKVQGVIQPQDKIKVEFRPTSVFDISIKAIDLPTDTSLKAFNILPADRFFIYPQNSALLYLTPKKLLTSVPPGPTPVFAMGSGKLGIRVTRLSAKALDQLIPHDSIRYFRELQTSLQGACYSPKDISVIGDSRGGDGETETRVRERIGLGKGDSRKMIQLGPIELTEKADSSFAILELVENVKSSTAEAARCDTAAARIGGVSALKGHFGMHPKDSVQAHDDLWSTVSVTVVQIAPDFSDAWVKSSIDTKVDSIPLKKSGVGTSLDFISPALEAHRHVTYQICTKPDEKSIRTRISSSRATRCLHDEAIPQLNIPADLPSSVRLQPGIVAVNQVRDVRATINLVFLWDKPAYFRQGGRSGFQPSGDVNPTFGLEIDQNRFILLMGMQLRIIEQAGIVTGLRFGDPSASAKWSIRRNWYVGFSVDPGLFDQLNGRRTTPNKQDKQ